MAGYDKVIMAGKEGGFMGDDGINSDYLLILVGTGFRQWFELARSTIRLKKETHVSVVVPERPDMKNSIYDAIILFYPELFAESKYYQSLIEDLKHVKKVFLDRGENVPRNWEQIKQELYPLVKKIPVYTAELQKMELLESIVQEHEGIN